MAGREILTGKIYAINGVVRGPVPNKIEATDKDLVCRKRRRPTALVRSSKEVPLTVFSLSTGRVSIPGAGSNFKSTNNRPNKTMLAKEETNHRHIPEPQLPMNSTRKNRNYK